MTKTSEKLFEFQRDKIAKAAGTEILADAAYAHAAAEFAELTKFYGEFKGELGNPIRDLVKQWGPKLTTYFGLPGAAGLLTAAAADKGAFSGIFGMIGKLFGIGT